MAKSEPENLGVGQSGRQLSPHERGVLAVGQLLSGAYYLTVVAPGKPGPQTMATAERAVAAYLDAVCCEPPMSFEGPADVVLDNLRLEQEIKPLRQFAEWVVGIGGESGTGAAGWLTKLPQIMYRAKAALGDPAERGGEVSE